MFSPIPADTKMVIKHPLLMLLNFCTGYYIITVTENNERRI